MTIKVAIDRTNTNARARETNQITKKRKKRKNSPPIPQTLCPTQKTQRAKALRLHLDRHVEPLGNRISAKGHPAQAPEEHHGGGQAFGRLGAVVAPDLGHELDAPADGADGAEDGGGRGDGAGLRGHDSFFFFFI